MKKILFLCGCIMLILTAGFADGYLRKQQAAEVLAQEDGAETVPAEDMPDETIRVLLKTKDFVSEYHEQVTLSAADGFQAVCGERTLEFPAGDTTFETDSEEFKDTDTLRLTSADGAFEIRGLARDRKSERYSGTLELRRTDGGLLLINELPLEEYLCGVVTSEMPSSYPAEALKAQAVCARTYAKKCMEERRAEQFFADVDDSVSYQVYNNQERAQETDSAVRETAGIVLVRDGALVDAMYYSTSCGLDLQEDLSQEAVFAAALTGDSARTYEAEEPWYRWQTDILLSALTDAAELRVDERLENGSVARLSVLRKDGSWRTVEGEYAIREYLAGAAPVITLQNNETVEGMKLLPSAFFMMQPLCEDDVLYGYHLLGGGYGHGKGMSQNGAKHMALEGMDYREILQNYYNDVTLSKS